MARAHATFPKRRRQRERWGVLAVVALAAASGFLAAHFGTRRAWATSPTTTSTPTSVPFVDPQRSP